MMASVVNRPNGRREIQFTDAAGERQTIRLGKMPKRDAESVKTRIEYLLTATISKQPLDGDTAKWVASLDSVMSDRLAKAGLMRQRETALLGTFLAEYIEGRTDVKPLTEKKYRTTNSLLVKFFGAGRMLRDINPGDADDWRRMLKETRSENTVRKHIAVAKVFFSAAVRKGVLDANPFDDQPATIQANTERFHFVTREDAEKVIDACPDAEWRLIFALARFGGLRCPSEHLALTWDCIDWADRRIRVPSPKTEHHAGRSSRIIPLFPELLPLLNEVWDNLSEEAGEFVITRYRDTNANLRTRLTRIIERAGLEVWPKLFQNLRSTRETELAEQYPIHVVCQWLGNTQAIAAKHYLQVTDAHFQSASKSAQNPTQTVQDRGVWRGQPSTSGVKKSEKLPPGKRCLPLPMLSIAEAGLEPARGIPPTGF